jgi:hypothetical protein
VFLRNAEVAKTKEVLAELVGEVATTTRQYEPARTCSEPLATRLCTYSMSISPSSANIISSSMTGAVVC